MKAVSIATARNTLTERLYEAEAGEPVQITRRGQPVAVLLAADEYQRLKAAAGAASDFAGWARQWRARQAPGQEGIRPEELARWCDW
jgi:prevent-host-death family protein